MNDYKPGTVAMVTADNRRDEYRAFFDGRTWRELACYAFCVDTPTTLRPLVVLDLNGVSPEAIVRTLRQRHVEAMGTIPGSTGWDVVADQIEAQTKPPRIPEPGLWGVVSETVGDGTTYFVHTPGGWLNETSGRLLQWHDIPNPEPVRPGIGSEQ